MISCCAPKFPAELIDQAKPCNVSKMIDGWMEGGMSEVRDGMISVHEGYASEYSCTDISARREK